jgi:hypothetical protein
VFNPAAGINESQTSILASIELRTNEYIPFNLSYNDNRVKNLVRLQDSAFIYQSPWLDLGCIQDLVIEHIKKPGADGPCVVPEDTLYLKLMVFYEFDQINSEGRKSRSVQVYKYPLSIENLPAGQSLTPFVSAPYDLELTGDTYFGNQEIYAWGKVKITGDITVAFDGAAGDDLRIVAGGGVIVSPGVEISPGVTLESGLPPIVCSTLIAPIKNLGSFCTNGTYEANFMPRRPAPNMIDKPIAEAMNLPLTAQPNPFTDELTLAYELPAEAQVQIVLVDLMGRPVREILPGNHRKAGPHEMTIDLSELAAGLYTLVMQAGETRQTLKVIKH